MKIAIALIVIVVLGGAAYFFLAPKAVAPVVNPVTSSTGNSAPLETTNPTPVSATPAPTTPAPSSSVVTVTYDGSTFSPSSVTVHKGDTVKFVNSVSAPMWVASDPHPTHQGYSGTTASQHCPDTAGTAFDECTVGATYSFVFQKVGSWGYHNHANHTAKGTIVVQ